MSVPPSPSAPCKVVPSPSTDSVKSASSAVITLDQIKKKAEEIVERKNSFCSTRMEEEEDGEDAKEKLEEEGDDNDEDEGCEEGEEEGDTGDEDVVDHDQEEEDEEEEVIAPTPKCQSPAVQQQEQQHQERRPGRKRPPSPLPPPPPPPQPTGLVQGSGNSILVTQPSEPTTPKALVDRSDSGGSSMEGDGADGVDGATGAAAPADVPPSSLEAQQLSARVMEQLMARSGKALCMEMNDCQPLWQVKFNIVFPFLNCFSTSKCSEASINLILNRRLLRGR